jgi:hypothetical protein
LVYLSFVMVIADLGYSPSGTTVGKKKVVDDMQFFSHPVRPLPPVRRQYGRSDGFNCAVVEQ